MILDPRWLVSTHRDVWGLRPACKSGCKYRRRAHLDHVAAAAVVPSRAADDPGRHRTKVDLPLRLRCARDHLSRHRVAVEAVAAEHQRRRSRSLGRSLESEAGVGVRSAAAAMLVHALGVGGLAAVVAPL